MKAYSVGLSMLLTLAVLAPKGYTQAPMTNGAALPILNYNPPPNFIEASYGNFEDFNSTIVNGVDPDLSVPAVQGKPRGSVAADAVEELD